MIKLLVVGSGGFIGAIARYGLTVFLHRVAGGAFPWGTLAVNVIGCMGIGIMMSLAEREVFASPNARLFVVAGLLGSFTTFSTFGNDTLLLVRTGDVRLAVLNVVGSLALGGIALELGRYLASRVSS